MTSEIATQARHALVNIEQLRPVKASMSPNFYRWMVKHARILRGGGSRTTLWRITSGRGCLAAGTLMIGFQDQENKQWFYGCRLMSALCNGAKAGTWAYVIPPSQIEEVPDFWERYLRDGRCVFDPEHTQYFVGDETRWLVKGMKRKCTWCGCEQSGRQVDVVRKSSTIEWVAVRGA